MIELFQHLSNETKQMIETYVDMTLLHAEPLKIPMLINDFAKVMTTDEAKDFVDFYFRLKMEELRNGDNYNQREEQFR